MGEWRPVQSTKVGGLVAVGFLDESRLLVGSHSGVRILDVATGALLYDEPDPQGGYAWHSDSRPVATVPIDGAQRVVQVAGLWGGVLAVRTSDGWVAATDSDGVTITGPDGSTRRIDDDDEVRAFGFSPEGRAFVLATSASLHIVRR